MTQLNTLELAKQGDTNVINTLITEWLGLPSITAKTSLKQDCLQVMLESANIPGQNSLVPLIHHGLIDLGIQTFKKVKIFGREAGEDFPDWQQEFELGVEANSPSLTHQVDVDIESATAITKTTADSQLFIQQPSRLGSLFGVLAGKAKVLGRDTLHTGKTVAKTAIEISGAAGGAALHTGKTVAKTAIEIGSAAGDTALQATQIAGQILTILGNNPTLKRAITSLNKDWLNPLIDNVDIVKAEAAVRKLQQEHPNEQSSEIAHHLMLEKAVFAGGSGLASSLVPGEAAVMFAVDFAATAALSVELVYQIAAAYGLDLKDSERKAEAVAIFGLGLGGQTAIKAGLGLLRNLPVAGAVIGASSNAVMIYALGYAACQFYEAKRNPLTLEATLIDTHIESEKYLEAAISQEKIMDQILVHIVLAGNPNKSCEEILRELQSVNLSPASIDAIAANMKSPLSLDTLLQQVNSDFAVPLLAQCHKIAHLDGVITPAEAKVIETIKQKLKRK